MKLTVIGFGQCGGRIADEFSKLNRKARSERGIEIVTGVFAVNTDAADLSGLQSIKSDYQHRILIGGRRTGGHGVGKINEVGADIAREDGDKIIDAIRGAQRFFETDAFLLIASAAGGTGSGSIPVMAQYLKERYVDKPLYAIIVLPFEHEIETEERTTFNTATCLKSIYPVADAVFLVDNQRYIRKDSALSNNLQKINAMIAQPFYNMLCAGEETKRRNIGAKTLDAGDIIQTLVGYTVIGFGEYELSPFKRFSMGTSNFRKKSAETNKGIQAMDEALSELSLRCDPMDAGRALYLLSAPAKEMNVDMVKDLGDYLREVAGQAIIRNGDYPRERGRLEVTVILSEIKDIALIRNIYSRATDFISEVQSKQDEVVNKLQQMDDAAKDIPSLL